MMKRYFMLWSAALVFAACGGNDPEDPTPPTPSAPAAITLSSSSFAVAQAGETLSLTITSPTRPQKPTLPDWITYKDGTYKDYKITWSLAVAANDTYEARKADITVSATGASSVSFTVTQEGKTVVPDPTPGTNNAWKMARTLGLGWNMGNHFDAYYNGSWAGDKEGYPDETAWQPNKATRALFDGIKSAGFTSVRIPVSWLKMIGPAPDYTIDETWMNRVYEVAQWAHEVGLNVIVNTHHDENHGVNNDYQWLDIKNAALNSTLNETIKAEIRAVWTQIAGKFKDCGDWLILESFNELNDGEWGWSEAFRANPTRQCNILNEWNQVFVDAVRATGGENATRWLGVPTYAANPEFEKYMTMPTDAAKRLMLAVHYYDPSSFTLGYDSDGDGKNDSMHKQWGHTAVSDMDAWSKEERVKEIFGNLFKKYVDKDIPVYLGEFGCSMRTKSDSKAWSFYRYYLEYVAKAAKVYGLPAFLWDNGAEGSGIEHHGYINHGTGGYIGNSKEVIDLLVKAMNSSDKDYTLQSVYDSAPQI